MIKVRELDALIAGIMKRQYAESRAGGLNSLRSDLEAAGLLTSDTVDLPDAAYAGGAKVLRSMLLTSERAGMRAISKLLDTLIQVIADKPGDGDSSELVDRLRQARNDFAFTATVAYKALQDVDYAYIAEMLLDMDGEADSADK